MIFVLIVPLHIHDVASHALDIVMCVSSAVKTEDWDKIWKSKILLKDKCYYPYSHTGYNISLLIGRDAHLDQSEAYDIS